MSTLLLQLSAIRARYPNDRQDNKTEFKFSPELKHTCTYVRYDISVFENKDGDSCRRIGITGAVTSTSAAIKTTAGGLVTYSLARGAARRVSICLAFCFNGSSVIRKN